MIFEYLKSFGLRTTWEALIYNLSHNENFTPHEEIKENLLKNKSYYEISDLYEEALAFVNKINKKKNGQYYTPQDVSAFLAKQSDLFNDGVWCDPCCGIGNISYELLKLKPQLLDTMYFYDIDSMALKICRFLFSFFFGKKYEELVNFKNINFLNSNDKFDYIIMNPPYGKCGEEDLYITFMKKACEYKGFVSITPQSFTNSTNKPSIELKDRLLNYSFLNIYCFDNVPDCIFNGRKKGIFNQNTSISVRAAITIASNLKEEKKITPLIRWKTADRQKMFASCHEQLNNLKTFRGKFLKTFPNANYFNFGGFELKDIISDTPTEYKLTIPSTPRYYITASIRDLDRSSKHILYFKNKEDFLSAYLILNSSYAYWWWRICDGGMTLGLSTLLSLKVKKVMNDELFNELFEEEKTHLVFKKNAGKLNENIKHSNKLINKLDNFLFN